MRAGIFASARSGGTAPSGLVGTFRTGLFQNPGGASTFTFTDVAIGTASPTRNVVVAIQAQLNSVANLPTSVTIGGVAATLVAGSSTLNALTSGATYRAVVPTGATATIVVTYADLYLRMAIGVWTVEGTIGSSNGHVFATPAPAATTSVTGYVGGFITSLVFVNSNVTFTWANATERYELSGSRSAGAGDSVATGSVTVTATPTLGTFIAMTTASLGP